MIAFLSAFVVSIAVTILVTTLVPLHYLIKILPPGSLRSKWFMLNGVIYIFIIGYSGYIFVLWGQQTEWKELPIPAIFLCSALYVRASIVLALQTANELTKLKSEAITDPLTKLYNRRYLDQYLEAEISRSKRYALALSILLVDIDYFKRVNDRHGHQAGDDTLSALGVQLKSASRNIDIVARYGGEEFLMICTNTGIDEAELVAERLRKLIELNQINITDASNIKKTIKITVSIGVASLSSRINSKKKLIQAADQALYNAKGAGRNRVVVLKPEFEKPSKVSKIT
ncbi:MAG TPA: GGDEF domain-containing protein [Methylophilaceae bacterium]|jgi:diguanylate cyclase (GGDEF)-like protein